MADEKIPLENKEMDEAAGGFYYYGTDREDTRYKPYTDTVITVQCPKCNRTDKIWYQSLFGIQDTESYWCRACGWKFDRSEMDHYGSYGEW